MQTTTALVADVSFGIVLSHQTFEELTFSTTKITHRIAGSQLEQVISAEMFNVMIGKAFLWRDCYKI